MTIYGKFCAGDLWHAWLLNVTYKTIPHSIDHSNIYQINVQFIKPNISELPKKINSTTKFPF